MNKRCYFLPLALSVIVALGCVAFPAGAVNAQILAASPLPASAKPSHPIDLGAFWHTDDRSDDESENLVAEITGKLQSIILPKVDLQGVALSDAIEYLRKAISEHNPEPDVTKRAFNVFLKGSPGADIPPITLHLENVPALDALREAAKRSGMKVRVEPYAVSIVPPSAQTERLFTADCSVSPEATGSAGSATIGRSDLKSWFESRGVKFPPGSSAVYLTTTHKLVVRQTRANFTKIQSLLSSTEAANASTPTP